nr:MAG TPA: hypothetical protein [Caudoviricetes sp.]
MLEAYHFEKRRLARTPIEVRLMHSHWYTSNNKKRENK